jgi:hypothetical protein
MLWIALEIAQIDHRSYLHNIAIHGLKKWYFQEHTKFGIICLKWCLHPNKLNAYDFNTQSYTDCSLELEAHK